MFGMNEQTNARSPQMNAPGTPRMTSAIQLTMPCAMPSTVVTTMYRRTLWP